MAAVLSSRTLAIPDTVELAVKARVVTVTGKRGTLTRSFKHLALDLSIEETEDGKQLKVELWFGTRKALAAIRTVCSHVENMIIGVTKGYKYKMRFVYAHFPINVTLTDRTVEIRNFLGEKRVRRVDLIEGVDYVRTADVKDQIELSGIDISKVSLTAARLQQSTTVKNKDIRKFLDGVYVSEKGHIEVEEAS
eukprot:CAMPEP_0198427558 /NCGR_PEP_ID=MMETSP1452-20131203/5995_1 /TAXON_ID=1181717 /ORGANISM="Synchroma pusillum, Strain CCMP3072" /LENGTH=192 /DNA_ID=CAMNT_0044147935 /DNA_START=78 /DNA_END=656 /DNA_ORIENTATION=+